MGSFPPILLLSSDDALERRLTDALRRGGFRLERRIGEAEGFPADQPAPAAVLLDSRYPDVEGVVRRGFHEGWIGTGTPVIALDMGGADQARDVAWLRSGIWSIFRLPADAEGLALQISNLLARGAATEPPSRLYAWHMLVRVATESLALARRHDRPLACVAMAIEPENPAVGEFRRGDLGWLGRNVGDAARDSDILGTSEGGVLLALLPDTTASGGRAFLERVVPRVRAALEELGIDGGILTSVVDAGGQPDGLGLAAAELLLTAIRRVA